MITTATNLLNDTPEKNRPFFKGKRVLIFIPAYNQEGEVCKVLDRLPAEAKRDAVEILVIDNFSTDKTTERALEYKANNKLDNLCVLRHTQNLGYGGSQKTAYKKALDLDCDAAVMVHGDGQYAPELIYKIARPLLEGEADMVFGSRILGDPLGGRMPLIRFLGNRALTFMQNLFLGLSISEYHSGYRAFSIQALKNVNFTAIASDYHFDTEIIILFMLQKLRIAEVEIPTHYGTERSYLNIWHYGINVLYCTVRFWLHHKKIIISQRWNEILLPK